MLVVYQKDSSTIVLDFSSFPRHASGPTTPLQLVHLLPSQEVTLAPPPSPPPPPQLPPLLPKHSLHPLSSYVSLLAIYYPTLPFSKEFSGRARTTSLTLLPPLSTTKPIKRLANPRFLHAEYSDVVTLSLLPLPRQTRLNPSTFITRVLRRAPLLRGGDRGREIRCIRAA